jgi:steroid delta-isomerase-like uncharacterized protein
MSNAWDELAAVTLGNDAPIKVLRAFCLHLPNRQLRDPHARWCGGGRRKVPLSRLGASNLTNMSNHRAIIQAFYEELWNKHDTSQIPELLHEDFSFRGSLGQEQHGHTGFAAYVDFVHAALSDYRCEIQEMIVEGNKAFARLRFSGMHRAEFFGYQPTGKRVKWLGAAVFTFAGEKISALWVLGDVHSLLQQLANNARP